MKLNVVVAAFVEVQSKAVVKVGVRVVYMKGVVHSEINLEGWLALPCNLERTGWSADLLDRKSLMESHILKVAEPIMSELDVDRGVID